MRQTGSVMGVVVASAVVLGAAGALALDATGWTVDRNSDGITVLVQNAPGYSLKAYRASMKLKVSQDAVVALIADAPSFTEWFTDCSENKIIKQVTPKEFYTYFVNDSPFPVMDRDSIIHTTITQDPTTKAVKFSMVGEPKFMPEKSDYVRVPKLEGFWLITPLEGGEVEVIQEMRSDTGGSVPAFLANQQVTVGPFKTFQKMRKFIQKPKYLNAKVDFDTATVTFGK